MKRDERWMDMILAMDVQCSPFPLAVVEVTVCCENGKGENGEDKRGMRNKKRVKEGLKEVLILSRVWCVRCEC